jgi:hypothetical protein
LLLTKCDSSIYNFRLEECGTNPIAAMHNQRARRLIMPAPYIIGLQLKGDAVRRTDEAGPVSEKSREGDGGEEILELSSADNKKAR